ncbi:MAG TPA: sodium:solute symporter [Vicinamibacterales bacterium]
MHPIDWAILVGVMAWIVYDGLKRTKGRDELEGYFLANRSIPWWAAGLSVMATQLSAITMIGTTGQGYSSGMSFVQFYFGLPLAMVVLSLTLVPFFYRARVYTAYEYLERRFDAKTRSLTSFLFLLQRGLSCGVIISAPAVVMSIILGLDVTTTAFVIGVPAIVYTVFGGVQAVTWTDVKIMVLIVGGLLATAVLLVVGLPDTVGFGDALHLAAITGRLDTLNFTFDLNQTYTVWSGLIGGLFLMLGYFGADQSQVQRYLTAQSLHAAKHSLLMSAYWKIPLQVLVLLVGILVYTFYIFTPAPMLFNRVHEERVARSERAGEFSQLQQRFDATVAARRAAAQQVVTADTPESQAAYLKLDADLQAVRSEAATLVKETSGDRNYNDANYVFPTFIATQLPIGLIGLMMVAIILAATDSIAAELNSLSTATVIDFYKRYVKTEASDGHYLMVSKWATAFWGLFASIVAIWASELGSLIEVVNRFGSYFYGSILGVFILAIGWRRANGTGAFIGVLGGLGLVMYAASTGISFLWLNLVGAVGVFVIGMIVSEITRAGSGEPGTGRREPGTGSRA